MGLLDVLFGRTKPVRANLDALFALPSAAITLRTAAGLVPSGRAGVCWKPPAGQNAQDVQHEIGQLLQIPDSGDEPVPDTGTAPNPGASQGGDASPGAGPAGALRQAQDTFGYRWLLLEDPSVEDLVGRVHMVNTLLAENGWGPQLLCSVFDLVPGPDAGPQDRGLFLVYLYKRGTFYPFAPDGDQHRDNELELRIRAVLGSDLPVEADLTRWFPLWDLPVR